MIRDGGASSWGETICPWAGPWLGSWLGIHVAALYQVAPRKSWGFNTAINVHGREGFPGPYRIAVTPADGLKREVQVTARADSFRYDDVLLADLRLEKSLFEGHFGTMLTIDIFNLLNVGSVLERSVQLNGPQPNYLRQTVRPSVHGSSASVFACSGTDSRHGTVRAFCGW